MRTLILLFHTMLFTSLFGQELRMKELQNPVEIYKDPWGVSHIYAQNEHDLFFTQGYRTLGINHPGQSGDPRSKHYGDLFQLWGTGGYFPVYFSKSKILDVAESKVVLRP